MSEIGEDEKCCANDAPQTCSCHPSERPPICQRQHAYTHCQLAYTRSRADEMQKALIEIRHKAAWLRGEQAYREFPRFVANRVKSALQVKGRQFDTLTDEAKLRRSAALDELGALDGELLDPVPEQGGGNGQ